MTTSFLSEALRYASAGLRVLPLRPGRKIPLLSDWPQKATTNAETIKKWWEETPTANIGIATGRGSGVIVLDIDTKAGKKGEAHLEELEKKFGMLPLTYEVRTGSGGRHLYFSYPEGVVIPSQKPFPDVEVKSDGSQVVAPPPPPASGSRRDMTLLIPSSTTGSRATLPSFPSGGSEPWPNATSGPRPKGPLRSTRSGAPSSPSRPPSLTTTGSGSAMPSTPPPRPSSPSGTSGAPRVPRPTTNATLPSPGGPSPRVGATSPPKPSSSSPGPTDGGSRLLPIRRSRTPTLPGRPFFSGRATGISRSTPTTFSSFSRTTRTIRGRSSTTSSRARQFSSGGTRSKPSRIQASSFSPVASRGNTPGEGRSAPRTSTGSWTQWPDNLLSTPYVTGSRRSPGTASTGSSIFFPTSTAPRKLRTSARSGETS